MIGYVFFANFLVGVFGAEAAFMSIFIAFLTLDSVVIPTGGLVVVKFATVVAPFRCVGALLVPVVVVCRLSGLRESVAGCPG